MSQELQLGKYEFYPYEFEKEIAHSLEELVELLEKAKSRNRTLRKRTQRTPGSNLQRRRKKI